MITIRDQTDFLKLKESENQNNMLSLLHASVSHEMITPLRCIISFSMAAAEEMINTPSKKKKLRLIVNTAKLL